MLNNILSPLKYLIVVTVMVGMVYYPAHAQGSLAEVQITVSSNAPGAVLLTLQGEVVGECPARFRIKQRYPNASYGFLSPHGQMADLVDEGDWIRSVYIAYVKGKVTAPGYYDQSFKIKLGNLYELDPIKNIHITLMPFPSKTIPPPPPPPPPQQQQQQQQQQQTVIIPGTGGSPTNDCISECKKMYLKGELKTSLEECYKLLCD